MARRKLYTCKHCPEQFKKPHELGHHVFLKHREFVAQRREEALVRHKQELAQRQARTQRVTISGENLQVKFS